MAGEAYVTLLTTDNYLPGAMVLAHSLRDNGTRKELAVMVTLESLSRSTLDELGTIYDTIIPVDAIKNRTPANLYLMNRPDLYAAFTKIRLWQLTQYRRVVYVDSDVVALRAPDELFRLEESFSAAPDIGWPDLFNSGVMALAPNMGDFYALLALAERGISFDGADQGLLNTHFKNYNRINFNYNCTPNVHYQYLPAYRHFQSQISMVHFIGDSKPWSVGREHGGSGGPYQELLGRWWAVYDKHYRYPVLAAIAGHGPSASQTVSKYVSGEEDVSYSYNSAQTSAPSIQTHQPSYQHPQGVEHNISTHAPQSTAEPPMFESHAETHHGGESQPAAPPAAPAPEQQRRFSAPHAEWNPATQEPPKHAKPEAANFPTQTYTMSADKELWQPPKSYPAAPSDMWFQVPQGPLLRNTKPIFPWEENKTPATRVFLEDSAPSPPPEPEPEPSPAFTRGSFSGAASSPPSGGEFAVSPPQEPFSAEERVLVTAPHSQPRPVDVFVPSSVSLADYRGTNAWDEHEGINRYVSVLQRRRKGLAPMSLGQKITNESSVFSPTNDQDVAASGRRESLMITDFPNEVERPSLPVTPAPIARHMFWGPERDAAGNLPEAAGVPEQTEWNPGQQLEQLRRNSLLFAEESNDYISKGIPTRKLPSSSQGIVTSPGKEMAGDIGLGADTSHAASFDTNTSTTEAASSSSFYSQSSSVHTATMSFSTTSGSGTQFRELNFDPSPGQAGSTKVQVLSSSPSSSSSAMAVEGLHNHENVSTSEPSRE